MNFLFNVCRYLCHATVQGKFFSKVSFNLEQLFDYRIETDVESKVSYHQKIILLSSQYGLYKLARRERRALVIKSSI